MILVQCLIHYCYELAAFPPKIFEFQTWFPVYKAHVLFEKILTQVLELHILKVRKLRLRDGKWILFLRSHWKSWQNRKPVLPQCYPLLPLTKILLTKLYSVAPEFFQTVLNFWISVFISALSNPPSSIALISNWVPYLPPSDVWSSCLQQEFC